MSDDYEPVDFDSVNIPSKGLLLIYCLYSETHVTLSVTYKAIFECVWNRMIQTHFVNRQ